MSMRIAMWSGPRNLSTALMYSFAARGDCAVWDEPFYAAYLKATGIEHPMSDTIIATHESDPIRVAQACEGPIPPEKTLFYQKHMPLHMVDGFPRGFMRACENVFLIRHPARVVASYTKKRESPTFADIGFVQQSRMFEEVAEWLGHPPLVIDSADIRADPALMLGRLCARLGIGFTDRMLSWPVGPKPYDGVWAPHWYGAIHASSGFEAAEGPLPDLSSEAQRLTDLAMPHYEQVARYRI